MKVLVALGLIAACSREKAIEVTSDPVDAHVVVAPSAPPKKLAPPPKNTDCESNADCSYDDQCNPSACVTDPTPNPPDCEKSSPPPGKCICADRRCTLMRKTPATGAKATGCTSDAECGFVASTGSCTKGSPLPFIATSGGFCQCTAGTCTPQFVELVHCKTSLDCSWLESPRRPVAASKVPRPHPPIKPCSGGHFDSICDLGVCEIRVWKC